jgi:hypothetical protein
MKYDVPRHVQLRAEYVRLLRGIFGTRAMHTSVPSHGKPNTTPNPFESHPVVKPEKLTMISYPIISCESIRLTSIAIYPVPDFNGNRTMASLSPSVS